MQFSMNREVFITAIQNVMGAIERKQTLPILSNILIEITNDVVEITATDLEIELKNSFKLKKDYGNFRFTIPGRKINDICKTLDENSKLVFNINNEKIEITSNNSTFTLATLPAEDYPKIDELISPQKFYLSQIKFNEIINNVSFAMAQQDVRYYLNGMLFEISNNSFSAVATDGHRLAFSEIKENLNINETNQLIVPRKTINELIRLISKNNNIEIEFDSNHVRFTFDGIILTSKLIDGKFPDYKRVIPLYNDKSASIDKKYFKQSLIRSSVISNDKFKGAKFLFDENLLKIETKNSEKETSKESIHIGYISEKISIGFNISYILDIINVFNGDVIVMDLKSSDTSAVIKSENDNINNIFVIMPMRI